MSYTRFQNWLRFFLNLCVAVYLLSYCVTWAEENKPEIQASFIPENLGDLEKTLENFSNLENRFEIAENPLQEVKMLFQEFVNELNTSQNLNLSTEQVFQLIRQNIHQLGLSHEIVQIVLSCVELLENDFSQLSIENYKNAISELKNSADPHISERICWPWEWNWFGLNKKEKKHKTIPAEAPSLVVSINEEGLPGLLKWNTLIGLIETTAGISCILGGGVTGIGGAVGSALIADGINRIAQDGYRDLQDYVKDRKDRYELQK